MKIAQMATTVPDLLPPEFAQELASLQTNAPPMGPAFVRRRMAAELGPDWRRQVRRLRARAGRGRLARTGASRERPRRPRAGGQAAVSGHAERGRKRPCADARGDGARAPDVRRGRHPRDRRRDQRAHPRGARLRPRGQGDGALRRLLRRPGRHRGARAGRRALDRTPADHDLARGPRPDGLRGRRPGNPQPHRAAAVRGLVDAADPHRRHPRRPAPRQLHASPARRGGAAEPARLRLHPHLPAELRHRRAEALPRADRRRPRRPGRGLPDLGLRRPHPPADRDAEHLGALHLRPAARRPRAHRRRRRQPRRSTAAARPSS